MLDKRLVSFGARLRAERERIGFSQEELAGVKLSFFVQELAYHFCF
jgi:ribosome-binding protein aMBF1 (putative translation factor)